MIDALYKEFGKDECKAVMQGGAKQWFEQYPLEFRVNTHVQEGKDPWHSVTLIGSGWQAVGSTACSGEQERPVDIQTFKKQVVELLARSGEIPLGQLTNKHQKAYGHKTQFKPPSTGLRALLLSEAFSSEVDVVPWADSPNPGEFVARLITPSSSDDLELNLLVTTAVSLLKTQPKQTMLLTQLCESLHGEFGKDRCQAVFHAGGGPRACFRSHPQVFRMTLAADGTTMSVTF